MRISDWSSDVCCSDLLPPICPRPMQGRLSRCPSRRPLPRPCRCRRARGGQRRMRRKLQIGRASCRERVCQYVLISVVAVSLKKNMLLVHSLCIFSFHSFLSIFFLTLLSFFFFF